jgi:hypothetical protein
MLPEVVSQLDRLAAFIHKRRVQRKLLIQVLRNPNLLQNLRQLVPGILACLLVAVA